MKKESKLKYIILIVFIVLALGYVAYDKLDINLKDVDLFKSKQVDEGNVALVSNNSVEDTIDSWASTMGGLTILLVAISLLGVSIAVFILPLFKSVRGLGEGVWKIYLKKKIRVKRMKRN